MEEALTPEITIETTVIPDESALLSPEGGEMSISFTTNVGWTAKSSANWMTVGPSSGKSGHCVVTIKTDANTTTESRTATLTISAQGKSATMNVVQNGRTKSELSLSVSSFETDDKGGSKSVDVTSNMDWTVKSDQSWCTVSPEKGSQNGNFTITVSANTTTSDRNATVTVTAGSGDNTDTKTVIVNQICSHSGDRAALMALYYSTGGGQYWYCKTNWGTDADLSTWYGITTDEAGKVTAIELINNNLSGSIPAEIWNLKNLYSLDLSANHLYGHIPSEIWDMTNLRYLNLRRNFYLIGTIPPKIGNLTNLEHLDLSNNQLTDTIPATIGNLTNLEYLDLSENQLPELSQSQ